MLLLIHMSAIGRKGKANRIPQTRCGTRSVRGAVVLDRLLVQQKLALSQVLWLQACMLHLQLRLSVDRVPSLRKLLLLAFLELCHWLHPEKPSRDYCIVSLTGSLPSAIASLLPIPRQLEVDRPDEGCSI